MERLNNLNDFKHLRVNDPIVIIDKNNKILKGVVSYKFKRCLLTNEIWVDIPSDNLELSINIDRYLNNKGLFKSIFKQI